MFTRIPKIVPPSTTARLAAMIAALPGAPELAAAEADLAAARDERAALQAQITTLSASIIRGATAATESLIVDLHRQRQEVETRVKAARLARASARVPLAAEVARATAPLVAAEARRLLDSVVQMRGALTALGEIGLVTAPFAIANFDERASVDGYVGFPDLGQVAAIDGRALATAERLARQLLGEPVP